MNAIHARSQLRYWPTSGWNLQLYGRDCRASNGDMPRRLFSIGPHMLYKFGDVHVDTSARQITRDGELLHLTRKAFDLLVMLLERRPAVVSKEAIHNQLWPDTFVSESSVQALISEIRQTLGETARHVIRTVHGVGYACSGEISETRKDGNVPAVRAWLLAETWRVALHDGENVVGRGTDDVVTIDAPGISRRHARILMHETVTIEDLGSKNGTWLQDRRVTVPAPLADGDQVRFGSVLFTFRLARDVDSTETQVVERRGA
jgi:DNA-binding winged helix-turn-helix (wHTH) protein